MPSKEPFRWGVIGPGGIANRFADAVVRLPDTALAGVWARDAAKAAAFAAHWHRDGQPAFAVCDTLDALLACDAIDAVYIATPHSSHGQYVRAALLAGKPVLCEKPLVTSLAELTPLAQLARERGVFLMEAMWTRFLPIYAVVRRWLQDGEIGTLMSIESTFGFDVPFDARHRMFNPALAGGTLLDIGIYNIAMTRWVLEQAWGACPEPLAVQATGRLAPTGVDQHVDAVFEFPRGVTARFTSAFDLAAENALRITGTRGSICLPNHFWQTDTAQLLRDGQAPAETQAPFLINGFEYEIEEAMRCVRAGQTESARMPLAESAALMRWIDGLRARLGVVYPFEAGAA